MRFTLKVNKNGLKVCHVRIYGERGFCIQTNGNLPYMHNLPLGPISDNAQSGKCMLEVFSFVKAYGTDRQKRVINNFNFYYWDRS